MSWDFAFLVLDQVAEKPLKIGVSGPFANLIVSELLKIDAEESHGPAINLRGV